MTATRERFWSRLFRRRGAKSARRLLRRLPLRIQGLENREVPATLYGLTENNTLIIFDSATPGAANQLNVTGLAMGENLVGIDYRPANEVLYGLSNVNSKLYTINTTTGAATLVGTGGLFPVATAFGLDFNPMSDRLRLVSNSGNNSSINPDTGVVTTQTGINGAVTSLVGVAYDNNFFGTKSTTLFGIDAATDSLYSIAMPASGTTVLVGALGVNTDDRVGFDIASDDGVAYAALTIGGEAQLFTIDTATGVATFVGKIGVGTALVGLSAAPLLNANPVINFVGAVNTYDIQGDVPVFIDSSAFLGDPDSPNFDTGKLSVFFSTGFPLDELTIFNGGMGAGQVGIMGSDVFFSGVKVGTFTAGLGATPLFVLFNADSSPEAAQAILRNVVFSTTDNTAFTDRMISASITDGDGGTGNTPADQTVKVADLTPPSVVSSIRANPDPTNKTSVDFTVTFNEDVTGVDATDFKLTTTGSIMGATVMTVTPVDAKTYTVTVDVPTGEGTVRLDLIDDDSILDLAMPPNPLGGAGAGNGDFTTGEAYTFDRTAPDVIIAQDPGQPDPAFNQPVVFFVSFSEDVFGFDAADIMVSGSASAGTMVTVTGKGGSKSDYLVEVSGATVDGDIIIDIAADAAADAAGNGNKAPIIFDNQVTLNVVNDAPTINSVSVSTDEDTSFTFTMGDVISFADTDLNDGMIEITLSIANGKISLGKLDNLTFSQGTGVDDTVVTFKGLLADVNAAMDGLVFNPDANFFGDAILSITADDLGNTGTGGPGVTMGDVTITVNPVNDAPEVVIDTKGGEIIFGEDSTFKLPGGTIQIEDIDAGMGLIEVTLTAADGKLTFGDPSKLMFSTGDGTDDAVMTFKGTLDDINAALNDLSITPNQDFNGTTTLKVNVDDLGNTGAPGPLTDEGTLELVVAPLNDAPVISLPAPLTSPEDKTLKFSGVNTISVSDVDLGAGMIEITLTATNGTLSLSKTTNLTFSVGDGTSDATMTFKGLLVDVNAALDNLAFTPNLNFNGTAKVTVLADDLGNTGEPGPLTDEESVDITITPVNDAPVAKNDAFTTPQNQALTILAPGVLANDTDVDGNTLSAILISGPTADQGTLAFLANGQFVFTPATNFVGDVTFTYRASDGLLFSDIATVTITVTESFTRLSATGADAGGGPHVLVYNEDGSLRFSFYAYDPLFAGGVSVATGDVNGDGIEDIITGAGVTGSPHVKVFSGANAQLIASFMAYDPSFLGGVNVAAGDVDGDGFSDIITGAGAGGGPHVVVYSGKTGGLLQSFFAYDPIFAGGVNVAAGEFNADGRADIVTGAGPGGGPHVIIFAGLTGQILQSWYAFDETFAFGVSVAAGEFNDEAAVFVGAGKGGPPVVSVFKASDASQLASIFAYDETTTVGVRVGTEVQLDGSTVLFVAPDDGPPSVRYLDANTLADVRTFDAYAPEFLGGVFVG